MKFALYQKAKFDNIVPVFYQSYTYVFLSKLDIFIPETHILDKLKDQTATFAVFHEIYLQRKSEHAQTYETRIHRGMVKFRISGRTSCERVDFP